MAEQDLAHGEAVFEFSAEQHQLRAAVAAFLDAVSPEAEVRTSMASEQGYDAAVWLRMADELGLQGLAVAAEFGGAGAGLVELAIVAEESGRRLYTGPLLSTALAALAIDIAGDDPARAALLPGLATGRTIGTLAIAEAAGVWTAAGVECTAERTTDGWRLDGHKRYVPDAQLADVLVVAARTADGPCLFAVDGGADGVRIEPVAAFDLTRRLGDLLLDRAPARLLGSVQDGPRAFERVLDLTRVLVAAEQVGGAQAVLDMAVSYAKDRVQFGRAIGSFQAVKHMCADALLDVESARSAAYYGAWAGSSAGAASTDELATVAPLAKAYCSDTFVATASMCMQVHGGISFTWEHPAHLYLRRARSGAQLWGDPRSQRELLAERLGL